MKKLFLNKFVLILFFMSFIWFTSEAQPYQYLYTLNHQQGFNRCDFRTSVLLPGGDVIVAGNTGQGPIVIARISGNGSFVWQRIMGVSGFTETKVYSAELNINGNVVMAGFTKSGLRDQALLFEINPLTGDIVWVRTYGNANLNQRLHKVRRSNNGLVVCGISFADDEQVKSILAFEVSNSGGAILWQNIIRNTTGVCEAYSIIRSQTGGYVLAGYLSNGTSSAREQLVVRLNSAGNITRVMRMGLGHPVNSLYGLVELSNGGLIVAGRYNTNTGGGTSMSLAQINPSGTALDWFRTYKVIGSNDHYPMDLIRTSNGFAMAGHHRLNNPSAGTDFLFCRTDLNGQLVSSSSYGNSRIEGFYTVAQNSDLTFTLVGSSFKLGGTSGAEDGVVVRTDPNGAIHSNCASAGMEETSHNLTIGSFNLSLVNPQLINSGVNMGYSPTFFVRNSLSLFQIEGSPTPCPNTLQSYSIDEPGYNVTWSVANATIVSTTSTSVVLNFPNTGTVLLSASYGQCTVTKEIYVGTSADPVINIDPELCKGSYEIILSATPEGGSFKVNGVSSDKFTPSEIGIYNITYTLNQNGCEVMKSVNVEVKECCKYKIGDVSAVCADLNNSFCVPLLAVAPVDNGIIGMDFCLEYDPQIMVPTLSYSLGNVVTNGNPSWATAFISTVTPGKVRASIYYNQNAPATANFTGQGEVICIHFRLLSAAAANTQYPITVCELDEAYKLTEKSTCWTGGNLNVTYSNSFRGRLIYQGNVSKPLGMGYVPVSGNAITRITTANAECQTTTHAFTSPNGSGDFTINSVNSANKIAIVRDILNPPAGLGIMRFVNGFDVYQMVRMTTMDNTGAYYTIPTPYMMIAADVNMNDKVRANDITLVQQRIVGVINEYPQVWNDGTNAPSLDWRFIDRNTALNDPSFIISFNYPETDGAGYHRDNVPDVPLCLNIVPQCANNAPEIFSGILLGDVVDGGPGLQTYPSAGDPYIRVKSNTVTFEIDNIQETSTDVYRVYVNHNVKTTEGLVSFDFGLQYDKTKISVLDVQASTSAKAAGVELLWNILNESAILLTSYSLSGLPETGTLFYIDIYKAGGKPDASDFSDSYAFLNGDETNTGIHLRSIASVNGMESAGFNLMPNPATDKIDVTYDYHGNYSVELVNSLGVVVERIQNLGSEGVVSINTGELPRGVYHCVFTNGKSKVVKKVILQ
ncbi:MAG: cohesin domain-containing protein [Cytophagaceae bacterium]